jgi:hypothetical protein
VKIDNSRINTVRVFSATMVAQRAELGEKVTEWIAAHPRYQIVDYIVTQSSDHAFHCVAITIFAHDPDAAARTIGAKR